MQCPLCQQENPVSQKFCGECGTPLKSTSEAGRPGASDAELQRALTEALEQQTATAEILKVISSSAFDLQPVLETLLENATRLCRAEWGVIFRPDGDAYRGAVVYGASPEFKEFLARTPIPPGRGSTVGRAALERHTVQIADVTADPEYQVTEFQNIGGFRTVLAVPMLREGVLLGVFGLHRDEVRPFTEKQIELVTTFADQAVIAIENVRLFNETKDALERQTATSEILRVISTSPTDVQPVFDTIVRSAVRLCDGLFSALYQFDGELIYNVAQHNYTPEALEKLHRVFPARPTRALFTGRAILERAVVHIPDSEVDPEHQHQALFRAIGWRSGLFVPMLRGGAPIGVIEVARAEPGPFSEEQIALLKTFADQAVIAIENVRLFKELDARNRDLTEALAQQTATSEILRVISNSPTDIQPVFDAIVRSAVRLCDGLYGTAVRFDGELMHLAAGYNYTPEVDRALHQAFPMPPDRRMMSGRAILSRAVVQVEDSLDDPEYAQHVARAGGFRAMLAVPMLREGSPIGAIVVNRGGPGPFSPAQIALLQTFADQAVIALENVRLFTELQEKNRALSDANAQVTEALDQQTATAEILRVISSSPTDIQPVFDAIVRGASGLLGGLDCIAVRFDGTLMHLLARHNPRAGTRDALTQLYPQPPTRTLSMGRVILDKTIVHIPDAREDAAFDQRYAELVRLRGVLAVPIKRDDSVIGGISVSRSTPGHFSERQIALLQTFADQAVIAIENVRLFTELQTSNRELTTALHRQTATSEILRAISRSQTDVQPVFDAIVSSAVRLLQGYSGGLTRIVGDQRVLAAFTSRDPAAASAMRATYPRPADAAGAHGQAIRDRAPVNIVDMHTDLRVTEAGREAARLAGYQSVVTVPLLRQEEAIGVLAVTRREPGGFTDDEIALLRTFADQAVIAIENARLLSELQEKNESLTRAHAQVTEALEQQTATSEMLKVISHSAFDLQPVFDTMAENAVRLCEAERAFIFRFDGELLRAVASYNVGPEVREFVYQNPVAPGRHSISARAALDRQTVHIPDVQADPDYAYAVRDVDLIRTMLAVPMLKGDTLVGTITIYRLEVKPFTDKQVSLVETFADQAVIAIENVRLFKELEARTAELTQSVGQLTALGEISRAVSSTLDVDTVLDTIVLRASQLAGADGCAIYEYDEPTQAFHVRATHNFDRALVETLQAIPLRKGEGVMGRATEAQEPIQIADIAVPGAYQSHLRDVLIGAGFRALLSVPLLREEQIIGSLSLNRKAPGEFPSEVLEVLKTFATQSALAIQNARLFREIADKSRQLEVASQHKSEFLANMSHELRTPLNAIIGFSEVLMQRMFGELNAKQEEYLKDIYESGRHLLSLINDILDLSKIEAGRMELELTAFDLPTAIDSALTLVRERATRRGIALHKTFDERVGPVQGDERKVRQVVLNLLSNAIKFTPEGGRIEIHVVPADGSAEVSVRDTGVGIAPEDQEAVFEEFRQVGASAAKQEGTGLGLALCRKFVELHGGTIWVTSAVGAGSTFTFRLPVRP